MFSPLGQSVKDAVSFPALASCCAPQGPAIAVTPGLGMLAVLALPLGASGRETSAFIWNLKQEPLMAGTC